MSIHPGRMLPFVIGFWLLTGLATAGSGAASTAAAAAVPEDGLRVFRVYLERPEQIRDLAGFDVWEYESRDAGYVLVAVEPDEYDALSGTGLRLELDGALTALARAPRAPVPGQVAGISGYPCYRTVEETFLTAQQLVWTYPTLAAWFDVGDSWQKTIGQGGYDMRVLRLTNSAIPGPKPKLFITSSIHAREYAPAELATRFAEYLVEGYDVDADATWLLDYHEVHLMLQANPDGRKHAETGELWRKNTNQSYCAPTSSSRGADLNRNFEFQWGCCGGSSSNACQDTYRGPFAASEPETDAVENHLLANFPDQRAAALNSPAPADATGVYLDLHSFGDLVLWPWGFDGAAPNLAALRTLGRKLAFANGFLPQQAVDLYTTDGITIDFAYGELGVAGYVFEMGDWFFQECPIFENTIVPDNLPSLLYAAKVARTPYQTPAGPEALSVVASPPAVASGESFELTAVLNDTRYNNTNGSEPTQNVTAAEYYVDLPPWVSGAPAAAGMLASDGGFNETIEPVSATVATAGLAPGRHIVFVRGRDAAGNWGAFSAAFVMIAAPSDTDGDGVTNAADCAPANPLLWRSPSPARDLTVGVEAEGNLTWSPPADLGATAVSYDVLRSGDAADFGAATCIANSSSTPQATDGAAPSGGETHFYLVRSINGCGSNLGTSSSGAPRSGAACP